MAAMMQRRLGAKLRTADDYATADEKEIKELSAMTGIKYKQPARRPQPKRIAAPASTLMNLNELKQLAEEDGSPIKARKALPSPPETAELGDVWWNTHREETEEPAPVARSPPRPRRRRPPPLRCAGKRRPRRRRSSRRRRPRPSRRTARRRRAPKKTTTAPSSCGGILDDGAVVPRPGDSTNLDGAAAEDAEATVRTARDGSPVKARQGAALPSLRGDGRPSDLFAGDAAVRTRTRGAARPAMCRRRRSPPRTPEPPPGAVRRTNQAAASVTAFVASASTAA